MDAFLFLTEVALDPFATETDFVRHWLDPLSDVTGGSCPARWAGTQLAIATATTARRIAHK
jgi:hypothetical protein